MICSMLLVNVDQVQQNWFKINQLQTSKILLYLPSKNLLRLFHVNEMKLKHHHHQKITPFCFLHPSLPQYALLTNSGQIDCPVYFCTQNVKSHESLNNINGDDCSLWGGGSWRSPKALCHCLFSGHQKNSLLAQFLCSHSFGHRHQMERYPTLVSFVHTGRVHT